jgi:hypothetical protein
MLKSIFSKLATLKMPPKVQKLFAYLRSKVQPLKKYFGRFPSAAKKLTSEFSPADEAYACGTKMAHRQKWAQPQHRDLKRA